MMELIDGVAFLFSRPSWFMVRVPWKIHSSFV